MRFLNKSAILFGLKILLNKTCFSSLLSSLSYNFRLSIFTYCAKDVFGVNVILWECRVSFLREVKWEKKNWTSGIKRKSPIEEKVIKTRNERAERKLRLQYHFLESCLHIEMIYYIIFVTSLHLGFRQRRLRIVVRWYNGTIKYNV